MRFFREKVRRYLVLVEFSLFLSRFQNIAVIKTLKGNRKKMARTGAKERYSATHKAVW